MPPWGGWYGQFMGPLKSCNRGGGLCQAGPQHGTEQPSAQRPLHDVDMLTKNRGEHLPICHNNTLLHPPVTCRLARVTCLLLCHLTRQPFVRSTFCHLTCQPFVRSAFCRLTCQSIRHPLGAQLAARGPSYTHVDGRSLHSR